MALLPHEPPGEPLVATRLKESHREWGRGGSGPGWHWDRAGCAFCTWAVEWEHTKLPGDGDLLGQGLGRLP